MTFDKRRHRTSLKDLSHSKPKKKKKKSVTGRDGDSSVAENLKRLFVKIKVHIYADDHVV